MVDTFERRGLMLGWNTGDAMMAAVASSPFPLLHFKLRIMCLLGVNPHICNFVRFHMCVLFHNLKITERKKSKSKRKIDIQEYKNSKRKLTSLI